MTTQITVNTTEIKGKNILFGFSLETGDLSSVAVVEKTSDAQPSNAGWLKEYPEDTETEEFKLADAFAFLAVNAPGYGNLSNAQITFDANGKISEVREA